jgi:two-component system LytT family sensor kinase
MTHRTIGTQTVIHIFACLHALMAVLTRLLNYYDDVVLTILTISMIVLITLRYELKIEMVAALTLVATFAGFFLGTYGADLIRMAINNPTIAPAVTTFIVTEIVGWSTYLYCKQRNGGNESDRSWNPATWKVIAVAIVILLIRISYTALFRSTYFAQDSISSEVSHIYYNSFAVATLLGGNLIFVGIYQRRPKESRVRKQPLLVITTYILLFTALVSLIVYFNFPFGKQAWIGQPQFFKLYSIIFLLNIIIYPIFSLVYYSFDTRRALRSEMDMKHKAEYQYDKLKEQINPHFLFNSLNILDYLVQDGQNDRASTFIHKLAGMYRYMLQNESEKLVPLRDEVDFTKMYVDLLEERFPKGLNVEFSLADKDITHNIVPCSLQQLVENAIKHNIANEERPLNISIKSEGSYLVARNNLQEKVSSQPSTKIGLKTIAQQYEDISGKTIIIEKDEKQFCVKLPLL